MARLLDERYTSILPARDRKEFLAGLVRFGHSIGFSTINALTVVDSPRVEATRFLSINNVPPEAMVLDTPANGKRDPFVQHWKHQAVVRALNRGSIQ